MKQRINFRLLDTIIIGCGLALCVAGFFADPWLNHKLRQILIVAGAILVGSSTLSLFAPRWLLEEVEDDFFSPAQKRYRRRSLPAMLVYVVLLVGTMWLLKHGSLPATLWVRGTLAILPALPLFYVFRVYLLYVGEVDELKRRIELEAVAIGAMTVCALSLPLMFLQMAKLIQMDSVIALFMVIPLFAVGYIFGKFIGLWRYR